MTNKKCIFCCTIDYRFIDFSNNIMVLPVKNCGVKLKKGDSRVGKLE